MLIPFIDKLAVVYFMGHPVRHYTFLINVVCGRICLRCTTSTEWSA